MKCYSRLEFKQNTTSFSLVLSFWKIWRHPFSSVLVVSNSLRPLGLQHVRPPSPSPTPGVYSNSCPLSRGCHLTISSFVVPFSSCIQSFLHQGLFIWGLSSQVYFSNSVMSDSLWPRGLAHTRLHCPSPTPRVYSNSCPLSLWCHPTISSSVIPFSCLQSFPASKSFPMSQSFTSGGQRIGVSTSASVLPVNTQDWFLLGWTGSISLSPRYSHESSPTPQFKSINSLVPSFLDNLTHIHTWLLENHSFD